MALVFLEGFSLYSDPDQFDLNVMESAGDTSACILLPTDGPHGRGAMQIGGVASPSYSLTCVLDAVFSGGKTIGMWFRWDDFDSGSPFTYDTIMQVMYATNNNNGVMLLHSDGSLRFLKNTTNTEWWDSADDGHFLTKGEAVWLEIRFICGTNNDGSLQVWVNGEQWAYITGIDYVNGFINEVKFHTGGAIAGNGAQYTISNLYVDDTNDPNKLFHGRWDFQMLNPTGDGAVTDFTIPFGGAAWDYLDEFPSDLDFGYLFSSTATHEQRVVTADTLDGANAVVHGVLVKGYFKGDTTTVAMATIESNGTKDTAGSLSTAARASYRVCRGQWIIDPDTSLQWGAAAIEAAEFGFEIVSL